MKYAFLTEMGFEGKIPPNHPNMRTEFAWMFTLNADHFNIHNYERVKGYDAVFIIFPKSTVNLNAVGVPMQVPGGMDKDMSIYTKPVIEVLKQNNKKVSNVQEGPSWFFNEYNMDTQFHFYNQLSECDVLFAHNLIDVKFYKGLFPTKKVTVMPTLMIPPHLSEPTDKQNKVMIGGNFCHWYGGFQSYMVATTFDCPIYVPASHCKRVGEEQVPNLIHLPWINWMQWMQQLSNFKYAVNLMPTVAAGTFSMNCGYWGIPCIGNKDIDTQNRLFPDISVDVNDINAAVHMAELLMNGEVYNRISNAARNEVLHSWHIDTKKWLAHVESAINNE